LVSTILCPKCKTTNSKKAVVCYKCKNTLKKHKNPSILSSNPQSKIELKIIAVGITIFVASNVLILNIAYDYAIMISGFATLLYLYFVFKDSTPKNTKKEVRSYGFKVILNYLIIIALGIITLFALGYI
jgi:hypothetical protein